MGTVCDTLYKKPNQGPPEFCAKVGSSDNNNQKTEYQDIYWRNVQKEEEERLPPKKTKLVKYVATKGKNQESVIKTTLIELDKANSLLQPNKYSQYNEQNNSINVDGNIMEVKNEEEEEKNNDEDDSSSEQVEIINNGEFTEEYFNNSKALKEIKGKELERQGDNYIYQFDNNIVRNNKNKINNNKIQNLNTKKQISNNFNNNNAFNANNKKYKINNPEKNSIGGTRHSTRNNSSV